MTQKLLAALALATAATGTQAADMKVAVIQSLTGPAAFVGIGARDGIELGLEHANASGDLGDTKLVGVFEDDATNRGQSITLLERYAEDPQVIAVLGPTTGSIAGASAQAANDREVPMLTTTNLVAAVEAGPWSFIMTQPGQVAIPNIANYATQTVGSKSCALTELLDNESYILQRKLFGEAVEASGGTITSVSGIKLADTDFTGIATKIASEEADCVFLALPATTGASFVVQLRQAGLDPAVKIYGMTTIASGDFTKLGGGAVEGVYAISDWVPGGSSDAGRAFNVAFIEKYGHEPDIWGAMGYSMAMVLANAVKQAGADPTREAVRDALSASTDVPVVVGDGGYTLDENDIPHYGNAILVVKDGAFVAAE